MTSLKPFIKITFVLVESEIGVQLQFSKRMDIPFSTLTPAVQWGRSDDILFVYFMFYY